MPASIENRIALELSTTVPQVAAAVALLDGGATVPFISRYRKEATGGLDDTQLRKLQERLIYLRELAERRSAILSSIEEQGSSPRRCAPRLRRRTPSSVSKISTCPTSRNAAPRRRLPARPASTDSPRPCWPITR